MQPIAGLHQRLQLLRKIDARAERWKRGVWSDSASQIGIYVLRRSRSLLNRRLRNLWIELCEAASIAMVASLDLALASIALGFVLATVTAISESMALVDRACALGSRKKVFGELGIRVWTLVALLVILGLLFFLGLGDFSDRPWLSRLFVARSLLGLFDLGLGSRLVNETIRRRIPMSNVVALTVWIGPLMMIPAATALPAALAFYFIILIYGGFRILPTLHLLNRARFQVNQNPTPRRNNRETTLSLTQALTLTALVLPYGPVVERLIKVGFDEIGVVFLMGWTAARAIHLVSARAVRALSVDLYWFQKNSLIGRVGILSRFATNWAIFTYVPLSIAFFALAGNSRNTRWFILQSSLMIIRDLILTLGPGMASVNIGKPTSTKFDFNLKLLPKLTANTRRKIARRLSQSLIQSGVSQRSIQITHLTSRSIWVSFTDPDDRSDSEWLYILLSAAPTLVQSGASLASPPEVPSEDSLRKAVDRSAPFPMDQLTDLEFHEYQRMLIAAASEPAILDPKPIELKARGQKFRPLRTSRGLIGITPWLLIAAVCLSIASETSQAQASPPPLYLYCPSEKIEAPMAIGTSPRERRSLAEFYFQQPPYLPPFLSCLQFVDRVYSELGRRGLNGLGQQPLLSDTRRGYARLRMPLRAPIYRLCASDEYCRLKFPFWIGPWLPQVISRAWKNRRVDQAASGCRAPRIRPSPGPALTTVSSKSDSQVQFWLTPNRTFADETMSLLRRADHGWVVISAMTSGNTFWQSLVEEASRKPKLQIVLLLDLNLLLLEHSIAWFTNPLPSNLHLLTIPTSPERYGAFHIKGAAWIDDKGRGQRFVYSATNLTDSRKSRLVDLGWTTTGRQEAEGFTLKIRSLVQDLCHEPEWADCASQIRFGQRAAEQARITPRLRRSCEAVNRGLARFDLMPGAAPAFGFERSAGDTLARLLEAAQFRAFAFTHHFDSLESARKIAAIQKAGKAGELWIGDGSDRTPQAVRALSPRSRFEYEPHLKAALVDQRLWISTGNLTAHGLEDAYESFWLTEDTRWIRAVESFRKCVLLNPSPSWMEANRCFELEQSHGAIKSRPVQSPAPENRAELRDSS